MEGGADAAATAVQPPASAASKKSADIRKYAKKDGDADAAAKAEATKAAAAVAPVNQA